jgi:hypothetical protein
MENTEAGEKPIIPDDSSSEDDLISELELSQGIYSFLWDFDGLMGPQELALRSIE